MDDPNKLVDSETGQVLAHIDYLPEHGGVDVLMDSSERVIRVRAFIAHTDPENPDHTWLWSGWLERPAEGPVELHWADIATDTVYRGGELKGGQMAVARSELESFVREVASNTDAHTADGWRDAAQALVKRLDEGDPED